MRVEGEVEVIKFRYLCMSEEKPDEVEPVEEERAGSKEVLGEG